MARFVSLALNDPPNEITWVNADLITSLRPSDGGTMIYFDKDHSLAVNDPVDRVMLQISTGPITS
jgi:hypothetical protein